MILIIDHLIFQHLRVDVLVKRNLVAIRLHINQIQSEGNVLCRLLIKVILAEVEGRTRIH